VGFLLGRFLDWGFLVLLVMRDILHFSVRKLSVSAFFRLTSDH
jgi:hypothetical protein